MKQKSKKQILIIFVPALLGITIFFYAACRKQFNPETQNPNSLIENARSWFLNDIIRKEKEMIAQPYSVLPSYDPARRFARMRRLNELLNWSKAKEYNQYGVNYVVIPIEEDVKPLKNKDFEAARSLAFYKGQSGEMHLNVIEMLSQKGSTLDDNIQEIASTAFVNKYLGKNNKISNLNSSIIFYNESYRNECSFQVTNGSWARANINLQNKSGAPKRRTVPLMLGRTTCQTCQHWYLVGFWYDPQTGAVLDYQILNEWDECTNSGEAGYGNIPPEPSPSQQCVDENEAALNALVNGVTVDNETISFEVSTINDIKKTKNPKWVVLKSGGFWKLVSTEIGIVKLINGSTNTWQWESLTHGSIVKEGAVLGGEVNVESQTGTPSFTSGTQNILYAGMSLDFTVKYTVTPIPCPPFDVILPPVYVNYQSNAIWPATP